MPAALKAHIVSARSHGSKPSAMGWAQASRQHHPAVPLARPSPFRRARNVKRPCLLHAPQITGSRAAQVDCRQCHKQVWRREEDAATSLPLCIGCRRHAAYEPIRPKRLSKAASASPSRPATAPARGGGAADQARSDSLGVGIETYRELKALQAREITENDYDLLLKLHSHANRRTLDPRVVAGFDCFRRPKQTSTRDPPEPCAVCLCDMQAGELLCRLPCAAGHVFHAECIGEWLRTASTCCAVCKEDLSSAASLAV